MIDIRSYRERDRQAVAAIILPIQQQEFGIAINAVDQPDLQDIRGFYQTGNRGFWVACHRGEVVGTVASGGGVIGACARPCPETSHQRYFSWHHRPVYFCPTFLPQTGIQRRDARRPARRLSPNGGRHPLFLFIASIAINPRSAPPARRRGGARAHISFLIFNPR